MTDPWTAPGKPNSTRFVCPFEDWFYDDPYDTFDEIPDDVAMGATTLEEMMHARTAALLTAKYQRTDGAIREHLETHTLEQWLAATVKLQQIQLSVKVLAEVPPPPTERIHDALCSGTLAINDARWIRHAQALVEAFIATTGGDDA